MSAILKTIFKTVTKERKGKFSNWKYDSLEIKSNPGKLFQNDNFNFLKGSDELRKMLKHAINTKNEGAALKIVNHIKHHQANDIKSYQIILKTARKYFKNIDITDLL
jgi:hypothetical protein